ncbi:MAG: alpha/beta hydrolase [Pseudomonadota bacterium]
MACRPSLCVNLFAAGSSEISLFYLHGGAYVFGSPWTHKAMVARLCAELGCPAVLPSYRLAPEHRFPGALEDAVSTYAAWRSGHRRVVIGGDSAGGGLALALLAEIELRGLEPPMGLFAFSPWTDLTANAQSLATNAQSDVLLPAERMPEIAQMYLGGHDPADPRASPLFASFSKTVPVWMSVSETEILLDDTREMAARMTRQGVPVDLHIEHNLPHVWPMFHNYLPEARVTLERLGVWIRQLEAQVGDN